MHFHSFSCLLPPPIQHRSCPISENFLKTIFACIITTSSFLSRGKRMAQLLVYLQKWLPSNSIYLILVLKIENQNWVLAVESFFLLIVLRKKFCHQLLILLQNPLHCLMEPQGTVLYNKIKICVIIFFFWCPYDFFFNLFTFLS